MQHPAGLAPRHPGDLRVLVVDDEPSIREMHSRWLGAAGIEILTADNGAHALEMVRRATPDVVVTDLDMPVMDGLDLCRRLRADAATRHVSVVVLTGDPSDQTRAAALEVGCDVFLAKPCPGPVLLSAIRMLAGWLAQASVGPSVPA